MLDLSKELSEYFLIKPPSCAGNGVSPEQASCAGNGVSLPEASAFEVELDLPASLSYFSGHFPQKKILPAVAIIDISQFFTEEVRRFFSKKINAPLELQKIKRLKIKRPMEPGQKLKLCIESVEGSAGKEHRVLWKDAMDSEILAELSFSFR